WRRGRACHARSFRAMPCIASSTSFHSDRAGATRSAWWPECWGGATSSPRVVCGASPGDEFVQPGGYGRLDEVLQLSTLGRPKAEYRRWQLEGADVPHDAAHFLPSLLARVRPAPTAWVPDHRDEFRLAYVEAD